MYLCRRFRIYKAYFCGGNFKLPDVNSTWHKGQKEGLNREEKDLIEAWVSVQDPDGDAQGGY